MAIGPMAVGAARILAQVAYRLVPGEARRQAALEAGCDLVELGQPRVERRDALVAGLLLVENGLLEALDPGQNVRAPSPRQPEDRRRGGIVVDDLVARLEMLAHLFVVIEPPAARRRDHEIPGPVAAQLLEVGDRRLAVGRVIARVRAVAVAREMPAD